VLYIDGGMHTQSRLPEMDRAVPSGLMELCRRKTADGQQAGDGKR
jgi:hypothetical protein